MPGHSAQRLIAQEPLLLVVDVIEVRVHGGEKATKAKNTVLL